MSAPEITDLPTGGGRGRRRGGIRWLVTIGATAASTYALDAVATATGLLLLATGVAAGLSRPALLVLLAGSYLAWLAGLRVNLRANWELLRTTGTSTNVLSKAAHDLASRRATGTRVPRLAAAAGYVGTEVVKELPYYVGAFGTTIVADGVTSDDAIVFLAGANLGAAGYEYALALATRVLLGRRPASFDVDWVPGEYLRDYYTTVEPDELATIAFFVDAVRRAERGRPVLLFGVGPTLHHVFLTARIASEIHLADYLAANLAEIRRWIDRDPGAHDWRPFVRYTLQCEGVSHPSEGEVTEREELTRDRITRLVRLDGRVRDPAPERYATVISAYCADSATPDRRSWEPFMRNVLDRVGPGGLFVTAALRRCHGYVVGGRTFPSAGVDETDLREVLRPELASGGTVEVRRLADDAAHGYSGIVLAWTRSCEPALSRGRLVPGGPPRPQPPGPPSVAVPGPRR
jgi:hypothetical protein